MSKTADEAFSEAKKKGCESRRVLETSYHFIKKLVTPETIIQRGLCIHSSLEGICYFLKFTHHNFLAVYPLYNI